ncbi:MAG: hypothetical protein J7L55_01240 [Desulfurococcales archaeon]|nr:hypothetical protein [Desulfurococcales archaeon]
MEIRFTARKELHLLAISHFLTEETSTPYVGWESRIIEVGELIKSNYGWVSVVVRGVFDGGGDLRLNGIDALGSAELEGWGRIRQVLDGLARQATLAYEDLKERLDEFIEGSFRKGCKPEKVAVALSYWGGVKAPKCVRFGREENSLALYALVDSSVTPQELVDCVLASVVKDGLRRCMLGGEEIIEEVTKALAPAGHLSRYLGLLLSEPIGSGSVWEAVKKYVKERKFKEIDIATYLLDFLGRGVKLG